MNLAIKVPERGSCVAEIPVGIPAFVVAVPTAAVALITPKPLVYWPTPFLIGGAAGLIVLGLPKYVRLKMFTNSARTWRFMPSLRRKFRPMFRFSEGRRSLRKLPYRALFPQAPVAGLAHAAGLSAWSVIRVDAVAVQIFRKKGLAGRNLIIGRSVHRYQIVDRGRAGRRKRESAAILQERPICQISVSQLASFIHLALTI